MTDHRDDPVANAVDVLLADVDGPTTPRPEFEQRLRAELLGDRMPSVGEQAGPAPTPLNIDLTPPRTGPRRRPARLLVATAAAVAAFVAGAWWAVSGGDGQQHVIADQVTLPDDGRPGPTPSTARSVDVDLAAAREACVVFAEESFGDRSRLQVVGPNNAAYLETPDDALDAATVLGQAFGRLREGLSAAGAGGPDFEREAARLDAKLASVRRDLSNGHPIRAVEDLSRLEELLVAIDAALTTQGVPQCF